jgi:hypothetical protein
MADRNDPRIPKSTNRMLRQMAQQHDELRASMLRLREEVVEEIETKEAELRALNIQLQAIDRTVQEASPYNGDTTQ